MNEAFSTRNLVLSVCELKPNENTAPAPRIGAQLVTIGSKIYLYGGADEEKAYADLHVLEIEQVNWKEVAVKGFSKPAAKYGHTLSTWKSGFVMFGGLSKLNDESNEQYCPPFIHSGSRKWLHVGVPSNDAYEFEPSTSEWSLIETNGVAPTPRSYHAAAVAKDYLIIHGGSTTAVNPTGTNDIYVLDLNESKWITISETGDAPSPRFGHKMVYYPEKKKIMLFGGEDDDDSLYSFDFESLESNQTIVWKREDIVGTKPIGRKFHSVDIVDDRLFVFAGMTRTDVSDLYVYEINKNCWSRPLYDGQINYSAHATTVLHDKLIVFGGARNRTKETVKTSTGEDASKTKGISKKLFFMNVLSIKEGSGNTSEMKFKLVTLGDSGVGKSSLLSRFAQDVYTDSSASTIGVDFKSVMTMVKGKVCTLQLWDTAGQERFAGVTGNYYRNADGFVIVYDATRMSSFTHVDSWVKQIQEYHKLDGGTIKLLIGNKHDLKDSIEVSEEAARACADKIGAIYVAASAKVAANVDAAFLLAAAKLVEFRRKQAVAKKIVTHGIVDVPSVELTEQPTTRKRKGRCGCDSSGKTPVQPEQPEEGVEKQAD